MTFAHRRSQILDRLHRACVAADRAPASVRLLAASKTRSAEDVLEAIEAGHLLFGENRAQELRDKSTALRGHLPAPEWHFIGPLQRNKVRYVVGTAVLVHAVDSLRLGEAISQRAQLLAGRGELNQPVGVLIEVNIGDEPSKAGVLPADALGLAAAVGELEGVEVRGLMCIPPAVDDPRDAAPYFAAMSELAARGRRQGLALTELSMGMSGDFEEAVRHGSTIVRVGTALFGSRNR
jgi:pyridoxal phosphate enzyme (YggS family)